MEHRHHRGHAVDQLKAEPQVHQHGEQGKAHRQGGLLPQLAAHLRTYHVGAAHAKVAGIKFLFQGVHHGIRDGPFQVIQAAEHPALHLVADIEHLAGQAIIFRRRRMHGIAGQQRGPHRGKAHLVTVIDVLFARLRVGFQGIDDLVLALGKVGLAGLFQVQLDHHFIAAGLAVALDHGVVQPGFIQRAPDRSIVRLPGELHIDQRAAAEIHPQRNAMPEQHG